MAYQIAIKKSAVKSLAKIPEPYFSTIKQAIFKLAEDPRPNGYKEVLRGRVTDKLFERNKSQLLVKQDNGGYCSKT